LLVLLLFANVAAVGVNVTLEDPEGNQVLGRIQHLFGRQFS